MANRKLEGKVIDTRGNAVTDSDVWLFKKGGWKKMKSSSGH